MKNRKRQAELVQELTDQEIRKALYMTQFFLLMLSLVFGFFLFENAASFTELFEWSFVDVVLIGGGAGILVVMLDLYFMKKMPDRYFDDGGINERLFSGQSTITIAFIAALVAVSEELFFRGMLQTAFGFIPASIIFALVHIRYLSNWYLTANVVLLSFAIGWLFEWTGNLAVVMMTHFIIDFLLGLVIRRRQNKNQ
ncbi:CPBP family intramembrane glutamic endopeptidase [Bacillus thermotolerans]|uniref:CAAX amino terminal protease family protein n=1 Tax=Bacillus thermotolerans TaxID=1221996 RepID=A0A0F5HY09_BACTR|nr:type II CAAX endopeptidase family protein [Bacillus thermotolerans]KKB37940.1 CAAX amino terminal protease family protein [Bacillus thermotolerans]